MSSCERPSQALSFLLCVFEYPGLSVVWRISFIHWTVLSFALIIVTPWLIKMVIFLDTLILLLCLHRALTVCGYYGVSPNVRCFPQSKQLELQGFPSFLSQAGININWLLDSNMQGSCYSVAA